MKKIVIPIIALSAITVIVVAVYVSSLFIEASKSVTLNVAVAPKSAFIKINDIEYKNGETYKIKPGEYKIEITREEFDTYSVTATIESNSTYNLYIPLHLTSGDIFDWYAQHPGEDEYLTKIGDGNYDDYINEMIAKYPILTRFPFVSTYYTILVDVQNDEVFVAIRINMFEPDPDIENQVRQAEIYKQQALDKIREYGFDPSEYTITYVWLEY